MSHCAQLYSALSFLSSMPPPPPLHTHTHAREGHCPPPSAATMKRRPALLSPFLGQGRHLPPFCPQAGRGDSWMVPRHRPRIAQALPAGRGSHQGREVNVLF